MPTPSGYQSATPGQTRRADFALLRRVAELERVVALIVAEVTVGSPVSFSFNAGTTEPPIGNQLRLNNASQASATRLWVSHTTFDGLDVRTGFNRATAGDFMYFQDYDDASKWVRYTIVSATDDGSYHDLVVTYSAGPGNVPFQKIAARLIFQGLV